jgi:hypothetical protein
METPNMPALADAWLALGAAPREIQRALRTFNTGAEPFRKESQAHGD